MCPKLQFEILPVGWTHHLGPILLTRDFLTLFKSDVGQPNLVMCVLLLFSIVSISFLWKKKLFS